MTDDYLVTALSEDLRTWWDALTDEQKRAAKQYASTRALGSKLAEHVENDGSVWTNIPNKNRFDHRLRKPTL